MENNAHPSVIGKVGDAYDIDSMEKSFKKILVFIPFILSSTIYNSDDLNV